MSAREPLANSSNTAVPEALALPESIARPSLGSASQSIVKSAIILFAIFTALTGLAYPALITFVAQTVFPDQAEGSLISRNSVIVGSRLVGQSFSSPRYFWSRPSSTTPAYNAAASSGSNLGPTNPDFLATVAKRAEAFRGDNSIAGKTVGANTAGANSAGINSAGANSAGIHSAGKHSTDENSEKIPVDIVTASASGLDPDISPAAARMQIDRVANARSIGREQLQKLLAEHTKGRDFGLLGDYRVNVLELNLALDRLPTKM